VGTQKRERQKANRQQRLIEEARSERVSTVKRTVLRWGIGAVAALGAIVLIAWIGGAFDGDDEAATDLPALPSVVTNSPGEEIYVGGTTPDDPATGKPSAQLPTERPTELIITDIVEGTGDGAQNGDTVLVNYVGVRSVDGVEFDNSYDRGQPLEVSLGSGGVIQGWDLGLVGVKTGGQRQLDMPAELAYGDADRGTIRPGDALTFVIEVVSITPAGE
jgi:peptidylprolyl isomerase